MSSKTKTYATKTEDTQRSRAGGNRKQGSHDIKGQYCLEPRGKWDVQKECRSVLVQIR